MAAANGLSDPEFTLADYEDGLKMFDEVKSLMQRLEDRARKMAICQQTVDSIHDLVRFCGAAVQQYYVAFNDYKLRSQQIIAEESIGASGSSTFHGSRQSNFPNSESALLQGLARECEIRTMDVITRLDLELSRIAEEKEGKRGLHKYAKIATESGFINAYDDFIENLGIKLDGYSSPYMNEKMKKLKSEVDVELLPHLNDLVKCLFESTQGDLSDAFENNISKKMALELRFTHCMEVAANFLQSSTDPLNINIYARNGVPYERNLGVSSASGSFGVVYQVRDTRTGSVVAVKQLSKIFGSAKIAAVRQELSMLEKCDHPNIVKLLDAYKLAENPNTFYLVIEPWAPYTLCSFIHDTNFERWEACAWFVQGSLSTEKQVIQIFEGLADGVGYLHNNSIKHKDIKPGNILLYDAGNGTIRPIISDLGISKIFKADAPTNPRDSTPEFLAPEQYHGIASTLKSDIWQLGCCFALTLAVSREGWAGGHRLWQSFNNSDSDCSCNIATESERFMATLKAICGRGTATQRYAHRIVKKMLEIDPADRWNIETVKLEIARLLSSPAYS